MPLNIEFVYCPMPGECNSVTLSLAAGATLGDALAASGFVARYGWLLEDGALQGLECGVWGRKAPMTALLHERDRVEIYRPLQCDPKEARRLRYKQQRAKG